MNTEVKYFNSTMSGAPALAGTAGTLIAVLDACLVNGFGSVTVASLVVASNVATATVSAGHNLAMVGNTGPVVKIEGATPAALNGEWRVASVPNSTTFTFATSGIDDGTATGTITAKRAPAGFEKAFYGTNLAAYRSLNVAGNRLYCRIDDTGTMFARIRGYETMDGIDSGLSGPFPTDAQLSGGGYALKSSAGAARLWSIFSDGRMVYAIADYGANNTWWGCFAFGEIVSYVASDAYGSYAAFSNNTSNAMELGRLGAATSQVFARSYTQMGGSLVAYKYSHPRTQTYIGNGGQTHPAPADNATHLWPIEVWEAATLARGILPGLWNPVHTAMTHGATITDIPQLPGRTLLTHRLMDTGCVGAFDITGPWR